MSTYKSKVEFDQLTTFLQDHYIQASSLVSIDDGEVSQAYFFEQDGVQKVLRINTHTDDGFKKDKLAHEKFSVPDVPIPKIEELGQISDGIFYAISAKLPGRTLDKLNEDEFAAALPSIIQAMDAIHRSKPIGKGFGLIDVVGNGKYDSWQQALDGMQERREDKDRPDSAHFFERDIYENARSIISDFCRFCPKNIRQLVHMDYGFQNTLYENGRVSGVIDWDGSSYGDPLYDAAWLSFWAPAFGWFIDVAGSIREYYVNHNRLPEHFEDRLTCYKMVIATNCMSFFAKSGQKAKYDYVRNELLKINPEA